MHSMHCPLAKSRVQASDKSKVASSGDYTVQD